MFVRLGEHDISTTSEAAHVDNNVLKVVQHSNYDSKDTHSDISILVLSDEIEFSDSIKSICLPVHRHFAKVDFTDWEPFIAGWGKLCQ